MYTEGIADIGEMIMLLPICPPDEKDAKMALIKERVSNRYLPAFEKVSGPFSVLGTEMRNAWHSWGINLHLCEPSGILMSHPGSQDIL